MKNDLNLTLDYQPEVVVEDIEAISHEEWLESRKKGIGGSDAGAILGLNKYTSALEIAYKKIENGVSDKVTPEQQYTLDFGHAMEPIILKLYEAKTGFKVWTDRAQYRHPLFPFMLGDCDGMAETSDGEKIGLEIKTYNYTMKDKWKSGVYGEGGVIKNPEYRVQVAHYMSVLNLNRFDLVAMCGNNADDLIVVTFYRDLEFEKELIEKEHQFWNDLQEGLLPVVEAVPDTSYDRIVQVIQNEEVVDDEVILDDNQIQSLIRLDEITKLKKELKEQEKALDEEANALRIPIINALDSHTTGVCGDFKVTFKGTQRESIDNDKFKLNFPKEYELCKKSYTTKPSFKIKKIKSV